MAEEQFGWRQFAQALDRMISGEKFEDFSAELRTGLILHNLVTRQEVQKPCRTCGTPRHDYSWWQIEPSARLLVEAKNAAEAAEAKHG